MARKALLLGIALLSMGILGCTQAAEDAVVSKGRAGTVNPFEENMENMLMPMDSLMMCLTENEYKYDPSDAVVFWSGIYYAIGNYGEKRDSVTVEEGVMTVTEQVVEEFAHGLYADFHSLPPIPEQLLVLIDYSAEIGNYTLALGERGISAAEIIKYEEGRQGTYLVTARLFGLDDNTTISKWKITIVPNEAAAALENPLFRYSISAMEKLK